MAAMGKWKGAMAWGIVFVVFLLLGGGLAVVGVMKARQDTAKMLADMKREMEENPDGDGPPMAEIESLKKMTPEVDWVTVDAGWFTYDLDEDWNRIPVRWP